jgi:hypothetical protein
MVLDVFGGYGIVIGFHVRGSWEVHEGMKQSYFFGGE